MSKNGIPLDRPGIFKARPHAWGLEASSQSSARALRIGYTITHELVDGEWQSWDAYEPHVIEAWHYVIGRDGKPNKPTLKQLAEAGLWNGDARVLKASPPDVTVQLRVKEEDFNGEKRLKVTWLHPGDYAPGIRRASEKEVSEFDAVFGSSIRAALPPKQGAKAGGAKPPTPPQLPPAASAAPGAKEPEAESDADRALDENTPF